MPGVHCSCISVFFLNKSIALLRKLRYSILGNPLLSIHDDECEDCLFDKMYKLTKGPF